MTLQLSAKSKGDDTGKIKSEVVVFDVCGDLAIALPLASDSGQKQNITTVAIIHELSLVNFGCIVEVA